MLATFHVILIQAPRMHIIRIGPLSCYDLLEEALEASFLLLLVSAAALALAPPGSDSLFTMATGTGQVRFLSAA